MSEGTRKRRSLSVDRKVQESQGVTALRLFSKIKCGRGKDFLWMNTVISF